MPSSGPELADVVGRYGAEFLGAYGHTLGPEQRAALRAITACRTAALGGHVLACSTCGHRETSYNSCRNRHCPKCQAAARARWLEARASELLPVPYFHVVFTLPDQLAHLALQNKRLIYDLLFTSVWEAMRSIARDPKHLGAEIGYLAVLHTWGQTLVHHPHLHLVVPGGGLSQDGTRWVAARPRFFLPVRVLSRRFRTVLLDGLARAFERGELSFFGDLSDLADPARFATLASELRHIEWVVYAKPPFGSPLAVLKYLGRYTHRVAIANSRLVSIDDSQVRFRYKDYRNGNRPREMTLEAVEFLRRFLQHVLPRGFQRIRHYGYLANRCRAKKLAACRRLLGVREDGMRPLPDPDLATAPKPDAERRCPACTIGHLEVIAVLARGCPIASAPPRVIAVEGVDSS